MMIKNLFICYLIALHIFLALVLIKTDIVPRIGLRLGIVKNSDPEFTPFYEIMMKFHERIDKSIPDGAVVFIGDSCIQGLSVSAVANRSENFGIGGDTTKGLLKRLPGYRSLERASVCVMEIGGNDIKRLENEEILKNYSDIIKTLPPEPICVFVSILPVDERVREELAGRNNRTRVLNNGLKKLCESQSRKCYFIDLTRKLADSSGNLRKEYHEGDGVHLTASGYSIFIHELKELLESVRHS